MITITSKKEGFRRCGVAHPKTATSYPDDQFSEAELTTLQAEPMLVVVLTGDEESKESGTKGKGSGKKDKPASETVLGAEGNTNPPEGNGT